MSSISGGRRFESGRGRPVAQPGRAPVNGEARFESGSDATSAGKLLGERPANPLKAVRRWWCWFAHDALMMPFRGVAICRECQERWDVGWLDGRTPEPERSAHAGVAEHTV